MIDCNFSLQDSINQINSNNIYLSNWLDSEIKKMKEINSTNSLIYGNVYNKPTIITDIHYRLFKTHNFLKIEQI